MSRFEPISFEIIKFDGDPSGETRVRVLRDKQTGVLYIFTSAANTGGMTVLLDANGKPLVK